jgi:hypothetical protein
MIVEELVAVGGSVEFDVEQSAAGVSISFVPTTPAAIQLNNQFNVSAEMKQGAKQLIEHYNETPETVIAQLGGALQRTLNGTNEDTYSVFVPFCAVGKTLRVNSKQKIQVKIDGFAQAGTVYVDIVETSDLTNKGLVCSEDSKKAGVNSAAFGAMDAFAMIVPYSVAATTNDLSKIRLDTPETTIDLESPSLIAMLTGGILRASADDSSIVAYEKTHKVLNIKNATGGRIYATKANVFTYYIISETMHNA